MPSISRRALGLTAAAALTALSLAACGGKEGGSTAGDMSLGNANAKVTVIEYASVTCVHCAAWNEEVFPEFRKKYIDTGKVRYVFREMLTPPADVAAAGFLVARCAGDDKYFQVVDAVMRGQQEMFGSGDPAAPRNVLLRIAQSAGMTEAQFTECVSDEKALTALNERVEKQAAEFEVQSTPTFVVNGEKMKEGAATLAELDGWIQPKLAQ
jgi:protein-disulfide isomerase